MPGYLVPEKVKVGCGHEPGHVLTAAKQARVKISGVLAATADPIPAPVMGCATKPPAGPPCQTLTWMSASKRVMLSGHPALLHTPPATIAGGLPPGLAPIPQTQAKVKGQ